MSVHTGLMAVEEFLKLPDPKEGHNELHHGVLVVMPPPKKGHQKIQERLQMLLKPLVGEMVVRVEMAFRPMPDHEVWQADVGSVSLERDNATGDDEYLMGSPELVVEVLSPSNTMDEIHDKMSLCMDNGCLSFWIADPKRKTVSVRERNVTKHYGRSEAISCSLLPGQVQVREIFE
jgi:Uma2 family endonuclease